jgi:aspartyl-tRNA(Asn)/glutamyl-tRNA(Gln) amidotransferase subunit A
MTNDVEDAALVLQAIAGHDARDSTSVPAPVPDYRAALRPDLRDLRIGVPKEYFAEGIDPAVAETIRTSIGVLAELGASVDWDVSLPSTPYALAVYYIIAPSECSANLARYDGVKFGHSVDADNIWEAMSRTRAEGFGPEVKRRIMLGTYALSAGYYDAYYKKAQQVRTVISREFADAFSRYDLLVTPTSPILPFRLGEKTQDPVSMYLCDVCTIPVNIAGLPAVSIPAGFVERLPVGLQLIAAPFAEETLLRAGYAFQQATDWHKRRPEIG